MRRFVPANDTKQLHCFNKIIVTSLSNFNGHNQQPAPGQECPEEPRRFCLSRLLLPWYVLTNGGSSILFSNLSLQVLPI
jgi:hypothetical protein